MEVKKFENADKTTEKPRGLLSLLLLLFAGGLLSSFSPSEAVRLRPLSDVMVVKKWHGQRR